MNPGYTENIAEGKSRMVTAIAQVAQRLGNTPAVCRACYVHPAVIDAFVAGNLKVPPASTRAPRRSGKAGLSLQERALQRLLIRYERSAAQNAGSARTRR